MILNTGSKTAEGATGVPPASRSLVWRPAWAIWRKIFDGCGGRRPGSGRKAFDEPVVVDSGLAGAGHSRAVDIGMAGDDQADLAFGQVPVQVPMPGRDIRPSSPAMNSWVAERTNRLGIVRAADIRG